MRISVIIPVYNVEKFLKRCIDSIISQSYTDLEIILIDDGSTDNSGNICEEYANKDCRIKVIHKCNGGLSDARNVGINAATGQLLSFIDSDDWIDTDMYEMMLNDIIDNNCDIAICGSYRDISNRRFVRFPYHPKEVLEKKRALRMLFEGIYFNDTAWDKLYKSYLFHNIQYPIGKLHEDVFTTYKLFSVANKIIYNPIPKYHYFYRSDSIMGSKLKTGNFIAIDAVKMQVEFISKSFPELYPSVFSRYIHELFNHLHKIMIGGQYSEFKIEYNNIVKQLLRISLFNRNINIKTRVQLLLFKFNKGIYKCVLIKRYNSLSKIQHKQFSTE